MYCPRCGCEYREGYERCVDCDLPLVLKLPEDDASDADPVEFEEVLKTFSPADILVISSLLDAEGIEYYFKNQFFNQVAYSGVIPSVLMVRRDRAEEARTLLKEMSAHSFSEPSSGKPVG